MEILNSLETVVASWFKGLPHLPKNGQRWLAENAWWLTLVGVILGSLGIISVLYGMLLTSLIVAEVGGPVGAALGRIAFAVVAVSLTFAIATVVVSAMAISPLKAMQKRGWSLLFLAALINVLSVVVLFLVEINPYGLIWGIVLSAVGAYLLFEVREYFPAKLEDKKAISSQTKES